MDAIGGGGTSSLSFSHITIGPTAELRLPFGVAIEADLLYKRIDTSLSGVNLNAGATANQWELPILLKYRFGFPIVKPYLLAGPSFRWLTNVNTSLSCLGSTCPGATVSTDTSGAGLAFGAGLELHLLLIRIAPEIRYTRWGSQAINVGDILRSSQNQAEFLVGISF
jgi:opacity protein-like surface antigen